MGRVLFIQWKVDKGFRISIVSSGVEKHECHNLGEHEIRKSVVMNKEAVDAVSKILQPCP